MKGSPNDKLRLCILAALSMSATPVFAQAVGQSAGTTDATAPQEDVTPASVASGRGNALETIIVTGSTSKRTLLDSSADITLTTAQDIEQKAPRTTADVLSLIPGIFVESTAGPVSNNYSVRGLPGGGQSFVMLQEDGMPILYGGGGSDEYFQNDITVERVEAVQGGTSGLLSPNGAGATINFISKPMNFEKGEGVGRISGATYGEERADLFYTAPLKFLGDNVAFMVGGYADSTKGTRSSPFTYQTYHIKGAIEKKFENGGSVKVTYKRWDEHDPYYADMPYRYTGGTISGVPGLSTQYGNVLGSGFANIGLPDSCFTGSCVRNFSSSNGIHGTGNQYRIDLDLPINDQFTAFAHARYLQSNWDFNGIFPGSGSGNGSLTNAVTYLTPGATSPINSLLTAGLAAYPGATQFGIRNLTTGQLIAGSNVAALNGLNGNGLLQQTVLNHQYLSTRDLGANFGVKYELTGSGWKNSLTVGGMFYRVKQYNDQSAVSTLLNGVSNNSSIYDVEALNAAGQTLGTLTNNGLLSYGNWGAGIWSNTLNSWSGYFSDELAVLDDKLRFDFGARRENVINVLNTGNTAAVNAPVPAGTGGLAQTVGSTFDGTYTRTQATYIPTSWTVGANYAFTPNFSVYARYAAGNETNGGNNLTKPTRLGLSEVGLRWAGYGLVGVVTGYHTTFNNQNYSYIQPDNLAVQGSLSADLKVDGASLDLTYRPQFDMFNAFSLNVQGMYQNSTLHNVFLGQLVNGIPVNTAAAAQYNGNTVARTPQVIYAISPTYDLPYKWGSVYLRYEYTGKIYQDVGNGLALPGYGVLSVGTSIDFTDQLNLNVNVYNVTNELGLTEGNPNAGVTQNVVNGYFYGRGIPGTNALVSLSYKF